MDPKGNTRYAEVWVKNGKRSYKFVDDQRKAKPITYAEAKKHFEKLPENRQEADKRTRAKRTFKQSEITTSYLTKSGTSQFDVEGLDTPTKKSNKEKPKPQNKKPTEKSDFYSTYHKYEELQNERNNLEGKIKFLEKDIKYAPNQKKEAIRTEIEQCKNKLKKLGEVKWQKKPEKFYEKEIDPRYKKVYEDKQNEYRTLNITINGIKSDLKEGKYEGKVKENFEKRLENNIKWRDRVEKEYIELRDDTKYIYWNDQLIEETIKSGKRVPTNVRRKMPEEYKTDYKRMIEKQGEEKLRKNKELEDNRNKTIADQKTKEVDLKESKKQLLDAKESFKKNTKGKINKEIWDDQQIVDFGDGLQGIMDPSRITLLTTNNQVKYSKFGEQFKDHKEISLENKEYIMNQYGFQYDFDNKGECTFDQEYIDLSIKSLNNPKIYYKKDTPLVVKDDNYSYYIAPRMIEADFDDEDYESSENKSKEKDSTIRMSPEEYKKLMKTNRADLVKKNEELLKKQGQSPYSYTSKGKSKHEVLYDLLSTKKEYNIEQEKVVQDIRKKQKKEAINEPEDVRIQSRDLYSETLRDLTPAQQKMRLKMEANEFNQYMKSPEAFEDYNPSKNAVYRGKETKAFIEWKKNFDGIKNQSEPKKPQKKDQPNQYSSERNTLLKERDAKIEKELKGLRSQINSETQSYQDNLDNRLLKLVDEYAIVYKKTSSDHYSPEDLKIMSENNKKLRKLSNHIAERKGMVLPPHLSPEMEQYYKKKGLNKPSKSISIQRNNLYERIEEDTKKTITKSYLKEFEELGKKHNIPEEKKGAYIPEGLMMR